MGRKGAKERIGESGNRRNRKPDKSEERLGAERLHAAERFSSPILRFSVSPFLCSFPPSPHPPFSHSFFPISRAVPDLLVNDIGMPDEDGYDLFRKLRTLSDERGGKVHAIALTAYARTEDRLQALRAGYQVHVPKPVELAELVAVAASLVRRG
jgi:CheY-like chemotaxis protein